MLRIFLLLVSAGIFCSSADTLLINPGFERWIEIGDYSIPVGWFTSIFSIPGSADRTIHSHTGDYGLRLMGSDTIAFATTMTIISQNSSYLFTGWAESPSPFGGIFLLTWLNRNFNQIGDPVILPITLSQGYREYRKECRAPDSANFIVINILTMPRDTIYVDDVNLESIPQGIGEGISSRRLHLEVSPNPFNVRVRIEWQVKSGESASLEVYDIQGRLVKTLVRTQDSKPGVHTLEWDRRDNRGETVPSGIYFCRLKGGRGEIIKKLVLFQ